MKGASMKELFDPLTSMIITSAGMTVMAIVAIAMDNIWGFLIGLFLVLGLIFGGILRYRMGDLLTAKITCLAVTVVGFVLGFISLFMGRINVGLGLVDILIVIPSGFAWYQLQTGE
jgi:hypothetical protein